MNRIIYILLTIVLLGLVGMVISAKRHRPASVASPTPTPYSALPQTSIPTAAVSAEEPIVFATPKKTPHYVSNAPAHGATLSSIPSEVKINFNFDVAAPSAISIIK